MILIPTEGPGTELKKLLARFGITEKDGCCCNYRAMLMNSWGAAKCRESMAEIVGWMKEEATKRGLPFLRQGAELIVKRAIRNSERRS